MPVRWQSVVFHILVVDDEPDVRDSLKDGFELMLQECRVSLAANGVEALDVLRQDPVDLIIADYRMPHMDGLEFLTIAQKEFPKVPRVMITAYPDADIAARSVEKAGVGMFIAKPFQTDFLIALVKTLQDDARSEQ